MIDYKQMKTELTDALNSYPAVFLGYWYGTGKTGVSNTVAYDLYTNTLNLSNSHLLSLEIYMNIYKGKWKVKNYPPLINTLIGTTYQLTQLEQEWYKYPEHMCNLFYSNPKLFNLKKLGYFHCSEKCYDERVCLHKQQFKGINELRKRNEKNLLLTVKSYIYTDVMDNYLTNFSKPVPIYEENMINSTYERVDFKQFEIIKFIKYINNHIIKNNKELNEMWKDVIRPILMYIAKNIGKNKENTEIEEELTDEEIENKNIKKIGEKLQEFNDSYKLRDIIEWEEIFEETVRNNYNYIMDEPPQNIIPKLIKIFEDDNKKNLFSSKISIELHSRSLTYFINKVNNLYNIIKRSYRSIFSDATITPKIIDSLLPDLKDKYKYLNDLNMKSQFKEIYILNKYNKNGRYPKLTLWDKYNHKNTDAFYKLTDLTIDVLIYESNRNNKDVLIVSLEKFQFDLQKILQPIADKYNIRLNFNHYYNTAGKNIYEDCIYIILFGSCNIPGRERQILSKITNISEDDLKYLFGIVEMINTLERLRSILHPYIKIAYCFTNELKNIFDNEINFMGIGEYKYKDLLKEIRKNKDGLTYGQIENFLGNNRKKVIDIINELLQYDLIYEGTNKTGKKGREQKIFKIEN